jgi:hypothetical protein
MKKFPYFVVAMLSLTASLSWAEETASTASDAVIYNVLDLAMQHCDGPTALLMNVHPQREQIQRSGLHTLGDIGYRVNFARIPDFRKWTAAVRLHDRSRQVDDSYVLFTRTGATPFEAAYVVTRLPDSIADGQHALQVVLQMQQGSAGGGKTSFIHADTPFGRGLEMIVGGRVGSGCFPTSHFRYAELGQAASIGISRFVVRGRDLIEYSMVLPWPEGMPQADVVKRAQSRMDAFVLGLEAVEREKAGGEELRREGGPVETGAMKGNASAHRIASLTAPCARA